MDFRCLFSMDDFRGEKNSNKTHRGFGRFIFQTFLGVWAFLFWGWFERRFLLDVMTLCLFFWLRGGFHELEIQDENGLRRGVYIVYVVVETFFFSRTVSRSYKDKVCKVSKGTVRLFCICCFWPTCSWIEFGHMYSPLFWAPQQQRPPQQTTGRVGPLLDLSTPGHQSDGPGLCISNQWGHSRCVVPGILHQATWRNGGNTVLLQHFAQRVAGLATCSVLHPSIQGHVPTLGDFLKHQKKCEKFFHRSMAMVFWCVFVKL